MYDSISILCPLDGAARKGRGKARSSMASSSTSELSHKQPENLAAAFEAVGNGHHHNEAQHWAGLEAEMDYEDHSYQLDEVGCGVDVADLAAIWSWTSSEAPLPADGSQPYGVRCIFALCGKASSTLADYDPTASGDSSKIQRTPTITSRDANSQRCAFHAPTPTTTSSPRSISTSTHRQSCASSTSSTTDDAARTTISRLSESSSSRDDINSPFHHATGPSCGLG